MAEKQAGGLSLRIGLTLNQLQSDFLAAEQTVKQGISALNRQQNLVKLRMMADTANLDAAIDKTKILEIQEKALTQLIAMQKDRLTLATKAYQEYANSKNVNEVAAKKLETGMEQERLALARLEAQLKSLSTQKVTIDTTQFQENISRITAKIQNIRLKAEIDTSQLQGVSAAFDKQRVHIAAVTQELELQRKKLIQLREVMYQSAKNTGAESAQTLNIKSNVLQQMQEISKLETKLKEMSASDIKLHIHAESFKQVENQIRENILRLNAHIENIRVKAELDTSKLGTAASEFDKAKVQIQNLNKELTLQNKKLAEMKRALATSVSAYGSGNVKTINLSTDIQKQIQEIDRLKAKIAELNKIKPTKTNSLLSGYLNIKGDVVGKLNEITTAFSGLKNATSSADNALTSSLNVIGAIPHPVGRAAAALASLPIVFKGIENSMVDMTKAAAASGDAVYVMSRGFQMSVADSAKFATNAKVAGVEVNDLANTVKFLQRQIARGGEDNRAAVWLKRYGESAYDASGNLKNLNEMTFALSRALKRAQADGKGAEFIFNVFRNISADAITAIEDIEEVSEQASKIVKNGLANPKLAHEVKGNLNAMNVQAGQMNAAFESALLPVANEIIPKMTERMGKFTSMIADNKDLILSFGRDLAEVWGAVENTVDKAAEGLSDLAKLARENRIVRQTDTKKIVERYKDNPNVKTSEDILIREQMAGSYTAEDIAKLQSRPDLYQKELRAANQDLKVLMDERRKIFAEENKSILENHKYDEGIKSATDLLNKLTDEEKKVLEDKPTPFFDSLTEKVAALRPELQKLHDAAAAAKGAVKEFKSVAEDLSTAGQERLKLDDKIEELQQLRKYYEEAKSLRDKANQNDYENQLYDLQSWLQSQLPRDAEQSMEKYHAVMELYAAKSEQIEREHAEKLKEIRESVSAEDRTALENKLANIEKEKQAWIQAGMDEMEAIELAQKRILKAKQESAEKAQQYLRDAADIEYGLTHTAFEKQMRDIEQWKDAQLKKSETAEEVSGIIANAAAKEAEAFEREVDRIKGKIETLEDKIFKQEHSQYEVDLRNLQKEQEEYYREGLPTEMIERWYNKAQKDLIAKAAESQKNKSDYTKSPKGNVGWSIIDFTKEQEPIISAYQQAINVATEKYKVSADIIEAARARETQAMAAQYQAIEDQIKVLGWGEQAMNNFGNSVENFGKNVGEVNYRPQFDAASFYDRLPQQLAAIRKDMLEGGIEKLSGGGYVAQSGYIGNLATFDNQSARAGMSTEESRRLLDGIYAEVEQIRRKESVIQPDSFIPPDTKILDTMTAEIQETMKAFNSPQQFQQTVTLSPQSISALQPRQEKTSPQVTNNLTVQIDNVNADNFEQVQEAADLIASKVRESVNSMSNGTNLSFAT